jgi:hypothetical protein
MRGRQEREHGRKARKGGQESRQYDRQGMQVWEEGKGGHTVEGEGRSELVQKIFHLVKHRKPTPPPPAFTTTVERH